ncbi:MAG: TatD family hydrolase [Deltaproteobacteria bacterium]
MRLIDSHCHVDGPEFDADRAEVLARAREAGVERALVIGMWRGPGDFGRALELCREEPWLSPTLGIHPHDCARVPAADWELLETLAARPEVVAIGETGLDYHYDHSPRETQRAAFERQLALAAKLRKPVTIHLREAHADAMAILRAAALGAGGVIHCFTGNRAEAGELLSLGLHLSFSGVVTFRTASALQEAAVHAPLDRMLVETDSPFLSPVPMRGGRNEPARVRLVCEKLALLRGMPADELARATSQNAEKLFRLPA